MPRRSDLVQEFSGYARQAELAGLRASKAVNALRELPIGGTAVGTGIKHSSGVLAKRMAETLSETCEIDFVEAQDHCEAQASKDAVCEVSGQMKNHRRQFCGRSPTTIRLLGSGPRCGTGEITIPATQPGSSIMPGKVNPVMSEMIAQVCAQVIGADAAVTAACRESFFRAKCGDAGNGSQPLGSGSLTG